MLAGQCYIEWLSSIWSWHSYFQSYQEKAGWFELLTCLKRSRTALVTSRDDASNFIMAAKVLHEKGFSVQSSNTTVPERILWELYFWDPLAFLYLTFSSFLYLTFSSFLYHTFSSFLYHIFSSFSFYSSWSFSSSSSPMSSSISVNSQDLVFLKFDFQKAKMSLGPFLTQKIKTRAGSESENPQVWDPVFMICWDDMQNRML